MKRPTRLLARAWPLLLAAAVPLAAGSCSGTRRAAAQGDEGSATMDSMGAAQSEDASILAFVMAANTAEINDGQLAHSLASRPDVRDFADDMVEVHTDLYHKAMDVERMTGFSAHEDDASRELTDALDSGRDSLRTLHGDAFDRAYLDAAVHAHEGLLGALDHELIPSASDGRVKAMLQTIRPTVETHLERAKELRASLQVP